VSGGDDDDDDDDDGDDESREGRKSGGCFLVGLWKRSVVGCELVVLVELD